MGSEMLERVYKTLTAYKLINADVLTSEEVKDLDEQIDTVFEVLTNTKATGEVLR